MGNSSTDAAGGYGGTTNVLLSGGTSYASSGTGTNATGGGGYSYNQQDTTWDCPTANNGTGLNCTNGAGYSDGNGAFVFLGDLGIGGDGGASSTNEDTGGGGGGGYFGGGGGGGGNKSSGSCGADTNGCEESGSGGGGSAVCVTQCGAIQDAIIVACGGGGGADGDASASGGEPGNGGFGGYNNEYGGSTKGHGDCSTGCEEQGQDALNNNGSGSGGAGGNDFFDWTGGDGVSYSGGPCSSNTACFDQASTLGAPVNGSVTITYNPTVSTVQYAPISSSSGAITSNFSSTTSLPTARSFQSAVEYNGYIYMVGGDSSGSTYDNDVDYALICNSSNSGTYGCSGSTGIGTWYRQQLLLLVNTQAT